jgi:hypothetical protein
MRDEEVIGVAFVDQYRDRSGNGRGTDEHQ